MDDNFHQENAGIVRRLFGPSAVLSGSFGTLERPGHLVIILDGFELGTGATLGEVLRVATMRAARIRAGVTR